jgi:hypothetical protein
MRTRTVVASWLRRRRDEAPQMKTKTVEATVEQEDS